MDNIPTDAGAVARQRFEVYLKDKLKNENDDTAIWEFYTFLLAQAKKHVIDRSGYGSLEYQQDRRDAINNYRQWLEESHKSDFKLPGRHKRKPRSL